MKKLLFLTALLISANCYAVEQKFVALTISVRGYNEINYIPTIDALLKQGWKIVSFSAAGTGSNNSSNIFVLLEK